MSKVGERLWAAYVTELRLLWRHWSYPVLHVLWAGLLVVMFWQRDLGTARAALANEMGSFSIGMFSLVSVFVTGISATRSVRDRFAVLEDSLPVGFEVFLGRWFACLTGLLGGLVTPLALAARYGPWASLWMAVPEFIAQGLITLGFASGTAWFLIELLGAKRWVYTLLPGFWLAFAMAQFVFGPFFTWLALADFMRISFARTANIRPYEDLWGYTQSRPLLFGFNLFYLGMALLMVGLLLWIKQRVHLRRRPVLAGVLLVVALGISLIGAHRHVAVASAWNNQEASIRALADQAVLESRNPRVSGIRVTAYDLNVDLINPGVMQVKAELVVRNDGQEQVEAPVLTLNPTLRVISADVGYEQREDTLTLYPQTPLAPGQEMAVQIDYGGEMWNIVKGSLPQPYSFTSPAGVRLTPGTGWYPLAGRVPLGPYPPLGDQLKFEFRVRVSGPAGWSFLANIPQVDDHEFLGRIASEVLLLGSPALAVQSAGPVTLAGSKDELLLLVPYQAEYGPTFDVFRRFFPDVPLDGVTLAMLDRTPGLPLPTSVGAHILWPIERRSLRSGGPSSNEYWFVGRPLAAALWRLGDGKGRSGGIIEVEVGEFLWLYYKSQGDAGKMREAVVHRRGVVPAFMEVYEQLGEAAVVRAVVRLRQHADEVEKMSREEAAQWVKGAAKP